MPSSVQGHLFTPSSLTASEAVAAPTPPPVRPDSLLGKKLGKYQITHRLGSGGMGVVYEAVDTLLKRHVALKLVAEEVSSRPDVWKRFLKEAQAAARLHHPNAVAIFEVDQDKEQYYIVMELVRGQTAAEYLKANGPMPWQLATATAIQVCRALLAAHAVGLVHRDIKPGNILLAEDGQAKLADFGLAKVSSAAQAATTGSHMVVGTPHYMSPEQCRAEPVDERSDVYSLGATYYALLTGQPPYPGDFPVQLMFAHCMNPIPDPRTVDAGIPEKCSALLQVALAKEPAVRYPSAAALLAALEAILSGEEANKATVDDVGSRTLEMPPPSLPKFAPIPAVVPPPKVSPFRSTLRAVGTILVFVIGIWLGSSGLLDRNPPPPQPAPTTPPQPEDGLPHFAGQITEEGFLLAAGHGRVEALRFSPDGKYLVAGLAKGDKGYLLWEVATGRLLLRESRNWEIGAIIFSSDSRWLAIGATGGYGVALHDMSEPRLKARRLLPVTPEADENSGASVRCLAFSPDGKLLAAGLDPWGPQRTYVKIWETATGEAKHSLQEHTGPVWTICFDPEGKNLITGAEDETVKFWNPQTGAIRRSFEAKISGISPCVAAAPQSRTIAVAHAGKVEFWEPLSGLPMRTPLRPQGDVYDLTYSPDGKLLATSTGRVQVWNSTSGKLLATFGEHTLRVAFSPDGKVLAAGDRDGRIILWDVRRLLPS
jgi:serine/threonine protein kinase